MSAAPALPRQDPIDESLEAAHLKVVGASMDAVQNPPKIDDRMKILVECVCTGRGLARRKDGELRYTATLSVVDMEVVEGPTTPTGDPDLFTAPDDE